MAPTIGCARRCRCKQITDHTRYLALLFLAFFLASLAFGQVGTEGVILGTVTDSSGATVQEAQITVKNLETGFQKTIQTDASGRFELPALPLGFYEVTVSKTGFKAWKIEKTELAVGDRKRISPVLQVGDVTETVSVESTADLIQTEKGSMEMVVQMKQIRELPLDTRNPLALVAMAPGMRIDSTQNGGERATFVQGQGLRANKTAFQLDGMNTNAAMDGGGTAIPNVDAVAEFNVQTTNFSAASGNNPMQVLVVTKSGTNEFHGSAWGFLQNDIFNARNTFAVNKNRVRYNQFGGTVGGPVIKNKTFFFGSFQGTVTRNATVYNSRAVTPAMKNGDFSALSTPIIDPVTKQQFPGNIIPQDRISAASKYFLPYILEANSSDGFFRTNASSKNDTWEGTLRVDHQLTDAQRIYGRYVTVRQPQTRLAYNPIPSLNGDNEVTQHSIGLNYTWTISPSTLLTASGGMMRTKEAYTNPALGKQNDAELAGIQGIPTAGREDWVGPPDIDLGSGYTDVNFPGGWGVPGGLWGSTYNGKVSLNHIRGNHTLATGFEYGDWHTYGSHGSACARGQFSFNNLYTGNGFADYLLGLPSSSCRNDPLTFFGADRAPYNAYYLQDTWRVLPSLTVGLGLRYERWLAHHNVNEVTSTWDPQSNQMVVATDSSGNPNLNAFPVTPALAAATEGLWTTAKEAGVPRGLYEPNGNWAPRVDFAYRPFSAKDIVIRGAYGIFYNSYTGNRGGSTLNVPHWSQESRTIGLDTLQQWETFWPAEPSAFGTFQVYAPMYNIRPARTHEWNFSLQTALPFQSALTLSYVGTRVGNEIGARQYNDATIGQHTDLQADRPNPRFSGIQIYQNLGQSWYHGLQTKVERRFAQGVSFTFAYSFSRSMAQNVPTGEADTLLSFSPDWYNRGRSAYDFRHIEYATVVWELPVGHGKKYLSGANRAVDALLGGWQLAVTQQARSGQPLGIASGIGNLGNGWGTRADVIGDPQVDNPSAAQWFNTAAFATPARYTFGNAGFGLLEGPGLFQLNTNLSKSFRITESKSLQFRWEAYNLTNRVNYDTPNSDNGGTVLTSANFGRLTSAGVARYMQFGLKFIF